jgi:hypothetical protein
MSEKLICSICDGDDPVVTETRLGVVAMCQECMKLGAVAQMERKDAGTRPNMFNPEAFRNRPATQILYIYTYFKVHPNALVH